MTPCGRADMRDIDAVTAWFAPMKTFAARRRILALGTVVGRGGHSPFALELSRMAWLRPAAVYSGLLLTLLVLVLTFFQTSGKNYHFCRFSGRAPGCRSTFIWCGSRGPPCFLIHAGGRMPDGRLEILAGAEFSRRYGQRSLWPVDSAGVLPARLARVSGGKSRVMSASRRCANQLYLDAKETGARGRRPMAASSTLADFYVVRELHRFILVHVPTLLSPLFGGDMVHHRVGR